MNIRYEFFPNNLGRRVIQLMCVVFVLALALLVVSGASAGDSTPPVVSQVDSETPVDFDTLISNSAATIAVLAVLLTQALKFVFKDTDFSTDRINVLVVSILGLVYFVASAAGVLDQTANILAWFELMAGPLLQIIGGLLGASAIYMAGRGLNSLAIAGRQGQTRGHLVNPHPVALLSKSTS
jgi:hypothetical protein